MIHNYCVCPKIFVILQRVSVSLSVNMCKKVEEHIPIEKLQHYDQLRFFPDIIEANFAYKFGTKIAYRTVRNNPPEESDFIPLTYQEVSGVKG